ncbi:MAG: response regulator transcription factor [Egibacteraceae bacterium]
MTATPRVLVVDDDEAIRSALDRALRPEGFDVATAADGQAGLTALAAMAPDVVVLDLALGDLDGIDVLRRARGDGLDVPVLVLSAREEVTDRVEALQAGADDYLVKPFALAELVARLHALLRRRPAATDVPLSVGDLTVDPARRQVRRGERALELTAREFELLECLARHPGIVLSRGQLLERVWGYDFPTETNVVDVFVGYLRRKLEAEGEPRMLHTVRGAGFVLRAAS